MSWTALSSFEDKKIYISKFRSRPLKEREYTDSSIDNSMYVLDNKDDCCFKFLYLSQKYDPTKAHVQNAAPCMLYHIGFTLKKNPVFYFDCQYPVLHSRLGCKQHFHATQSKKKKATGVKSLKLSFTKSPNCFNIYSCLTIFCRFLLFYTC